MSTERKTALETDMWVYARVRLMTKVLDGKEWIAMPSTKSGDDVGGCVWLPIDCIVTADEARAAVKGGKK